MDYEVIHLISPWVAARRLNVGETKLEPGAELAKVLPA